MRCTFTLIELLVVVGIIAILAAILLPSLNKARERARASSCVSNLKNIGVGARMYSDEQKDWIVPGYNKTKYWHSILSAGYTGDYDVTQEDADKSIYSCPSADVPAFQAQTGGKNDPLTAFKHSHYAINNWVSWGSGAANYVVGTQKSKVVRKNSAFKSPQTVKFICDNHRFGYTHISNTAGVSYRHGAGDPRVAHGEQDTTAFPVPGALTNCLFLDGHVEGITFGDMCKSYTDLSGGKVTYTLPTEDADGKIHNLAKEQPLKHVRDKNHKLLYDISTLPGVIISN